MLLPEDYVFQEGLGRHFKDERHLRGATEEEEGTRTRGPGGGREEEEERCETGQVSLLPVCDCHVIVPGNNAKKSMYLMGY